MTSAAEEEEEGEALKERREGGHLEAGQATGGSQAGQHPCSPPPPRDPAGRPKGNLRKAFWPGPPGSRLSFFLTR